MLQYSLLGKLYIFWQNSVIYSVLAKIYHAFSNAFKFSFMHKFLTRESTLQKWYEDCLITKVIDKIIDFVIEICRVVANYFDAAWNSSKIVNLCSGSVIIKFEFLFPAFVGAMYVVPHEVWSNMFAVLGSVGFLVIYAFMCAKSQRSVLYPKKLGLPLLIFVALTPITMLYSSDESDSIRILLFFFAAFIMLWLVASNTDTEEKLRHIMAWVYVTVIFTGIYAVMQRVLGIEANPSFIDQATNPNIPARVFATVDNPNNYAELLVLFMPLAAVFAMNIKNTTRRFFACCALAIPCLALLMTYSRSGWLSIAFTVLVFIYYTNKRLIPWIFVAAILCWPFLPASIVTRLGNLFNVKDTSANLRFVLWECGIKLLGMDHRWLTGIGLGPYTHNHNMLLVTSVKIAQSIPHIQMQCLEVLLEWGIFGFISYMWFIITKIIVGAGEIDKCSNKYVNGTLVACISSFLGIAILSVFEYIWFYPRILFAYFVLLGLMIACINMSRRSNGK